MYTCNKCGKTFQNKYAFLGHCSSHNRIVKEKITIEKEHICSYCGRKFETGPLLGNHVRSCNKHPKYNERIIKLSLTHKGKILSDEDREKVSIGMKKAHKEGRAWNIGKSRWKNDPSYPEKFFIKVIENEFEDKNYIREYPFGIYSLDFAWPDKKKCIEIDGDQHQRYLEYIERDIRKDKFLTDNGWQVLRISWKEMYYNTKYEIKKCKDFIDIL